MRWRKHRSTTCFFKNLTARADYSRSEILNPDDPEPRKSDLKKWHKGLNGEEVLSCTILTCAPNGAMAEIHNHMPCILGESDWAKWLGEEPANNDELLALLKPCPDE